MKTKTMKITGIMLTLVMLVTILGVFSLSASAAEESIPPCDHAGHTQTGCTACGATDESIHSYSNGFCTVCDAYEAPALNGDGYYEIDNAGKLYWFAYKVDNEYDTYGAINVILTKDITINEGTVTAESTGMRAWIPVGDWDHQYGGTFDGNGKTISGLYYNDDSTSSEYVALIACMAESGIVKNVTVTNSAFVGYRYTAAIVGYSYGTVTGCVNNAHISGSTYSAGIASVNRGTVELCGNTGTIHAWAVSGGIVARSMSNGSAQAAVVKNCWNTGSISSEDSTAGGIAGENSALVSTYAFAEVRDCWSIGSVSAPEAVGGVTGDNWRANVSNCYSVIAPVGTMEQGAYTDKADQKTLEQFASGEVAYKLGEAWGQTIGTDAYPVFATDTNKVYQHTNCDRVTYFYTNNDTETITEHQEGATAADCFDENGVCLTCGTQAVASLTTADATPVVTYYLTLEDAITAAQGADGSTITLLDDCMPTNLDWFQINSGIFTIDLNGKNIGSYNISTLIIYGGEITLEDSVGTGTIEHKVDLWGGHLTLKGGNYEKDVRLLDGELTVGGGNYTVITMFDGVLTLSGGTMDLLQIKDSKSTMADILLTGYHYYDANGSVVDISDLPPTLHGYDLANISVKKGADLSIDAVITVTHAFYTGIEQEPKVTVTVGGEELVQGTDFAVNYPNGYDFTNVGISQISIEGVGNYTGEANATYFIQKATLTAADITLNGLNATYDMNAHSASVKTLPVGLDEQYVTINYWKDGAPLADAPTDAGTHKVLVFVTDSPNYADAVLEYNLVIAPVPVTVEIAKIGAEFFYNGGSHTPQVLVTWNNGLPFYPEEFGGIVTYTDNYAVGTATATVSGNFTGSCTFEIQKGKPTITVSAPLDKVMPGYVMDITGATDAIDDFLYPTTFTVVDGEGYSVSGNTITIDEGVKIGSTITVKMVSTETKNFVAGEGSITLTVGVPMVDTPELEKDIAELEEAINDLKTEYGADVTELEAELASLKQQISDSNDEIDLIQTAITQLKEDVAEMESVFATKAELDKAIADLDAAMKQGDADLSDEIASLNTALTNAKAALEQADADNKAELVTKIETADATLDAAIKAVQKNLDDAKAELDKAIAEGDAELDGKIANLNAALESAKTALEATDAANKIELEGKIASAQTSLQAAIDQVQSNLDNAKAELDKAIADLDAAMKQGDADLSDEIANLNTALTNAKAALEQADTANKSELATKIDEAYASLDAAIKAVQKDIDDLKAALEAKDTELTSRDAELESKDAELENKDSELQTYIIIVSGISGVALCGSGALAVWFFIDKKRRI